MLVSASAVLALAGCSSGDKTTHLTFQSRNSARSEVDLGATGPSVGDELDGEGDILGPDGSVIGHFELESVVTHELAAREKRMLLGQYGFGDGKDSIIITGVNDYPAGGGLPDKPIVFAVTGGTGKYAGTGGQCNGTFTKPTFSFDCTLR